ncbi:hypothetical protein LP421_21430 [Rhizobium sp. RCAM05350]|nr:hypothetical protein LP421_21430 [Rhizobium sp. RCAM05350]
MNNMRADQRVRLTEDYPLKQFFLASILAGALALPAVAADYTIIAPANPGGGWDQTARSDPVGDAS